jgi:hypothetical protein
MKTWGNGGTSVRIPKLYTRQRRVVDLKPWPLYPRGKSPGCPLDSRLCEPQGQSRCYRVERNLLKISVTLVVADLFLFLRLNTTLVGSVHINSV